MTQNVDSLADGTVLIEKFSISGTLGFGGFGITYDGFDTLLKRRVAIKELFPDGAHRERDRVVVRSSMDFDYLRSRFIQEAQALARFDFPGIVRVHDVFETNGTAYMVMEYLAGESVEQRCHRLGRLSSVETSEILLEVASALEQVHAQGVLHRDVKPSNIVLTPNRGAVLIDFGSARQVHLETVRVQTQMVSDGYAAPEQYSSSSRLGPPTDIYGLGATAWHALTGRPPISTLDRVAGQQMPSIESLAPAVSPELSLFTSQCMQMEISKRPQSMVGVRSILRAPVGEARWPELPRTTAGPVSSGKSFFVSSKVALGAVAALVIGGAAILATKGFGTSSDRSAVATTSTTSLQTKPTSLPNTTGLSVVPPVSTAAPNGQVSTSTTVPVMGSVVRFIHESTANKKTTAEHRKSIELAIKELKPSLDEKRITVNLTSAASSLATDLAEPAVYGVFFSGGSNSARERVALVASTRKAFVLIDGTADGLSGSVFRTIATDTEQAAIAAKFVQGDFSDAVILSDGSPESKFRVAGYRSVFPTSPEVLLTGNNTRQAIEAMAPGQPILIAASDMGLVSPVLQGTPTKAAERVVVGTDGMFGLAPGGYLEGVRSFTSLAPVADDAALSRKLVAAGLGRSQGETALYAYEAAVTVLRRIIEGASSGEELRRGLTVIDREPKVRMYTYRQGAWV